MSEILKVGITHGDYNGIGYEVTLKALADERIPELMTPVFFAIPELVESTVAQYNLELPPVKIIKDAGEASEGFVNIVDISRGKLELTPGTGSKASGASAVDALEAAVKAVMAGKIDTLVTAPISKEAVQSDRFHFTGHTEYLAERTAANSQMILFDGELRVALLTTHKAIADVPAAVTEDGIVDALQRLNATLKLDFDIERPRIAVLSLNPHCGDGGLLGKEEIEIITPAIERANNELMAFGPFAADGFFATQAWQHYDGVLAMYHDQGLAPFKALAEGQGVNFTAGLPFVRTSPDHGTAFDIAGKGIADPGSMREALYAAIDLTRNRRRNIEAAANPLPVNTSEKSERRDRDQKKEKTAES